MRFYFVILFIIGSVVFCYYNFFGKEKKSALEGESEKKGVAEMISGKKPTRESRSDSPPPVIIKRPVGSKTVKFLNRPVPSFEMINSLVGRGTNTKPIGSQKNAKKVETNPVPVRYSVDAETNSVLLIGDLEEVLRVATLIKSTDQVVSTCHLKTWVVFVRGDRQQGFDLVAKIVAGGQFNTNVQLGGGVFSAVLGLSNVQVSLQAGQSRGLLEIVDEPYMQLIQAQQSVITTGEEIAIPTTTSNQGVTETSVEFKQVGLSLSVTPFFLDQTRVRLLVDQSNGVVGSTRKIGGIDIPEIATQSLKTSVEMRLGQVIVLGGVETAKRQKKRSWLSRTEERSTGHIYIVAAIYSTIPKAQVLDVGDDFPLHPSRPNRPALPWLGGGDVLPRKPKTQIHK